MSNVFVPVASLVKVPVTKDPDEQPAWMVQPEDSLSSAKPRTIPMRLK